MCIMNVIKLFKKQVLVLSLCIGVLIPAMKACDESTSSLISQTNNNNGTFTYVMQVCPEYLGLEGAPDQLIFSFGCSVTIASFSPATYSTSTGDVYTGVKSGSTLTYTTPSPFIAHGSSTLCTTFTITTTGYPGTVSINTNPDYVAPECIHNYTFSTLSAPSVNPVSICSGSSATLTASGCTGGTVRWYTVPVGGIAVGTGSSYTTPILTLPTTYYFECSYPTGCPSPRSSVDVSLGSMPVTETHTNATCGLMNGTIDITPSGGVTPYTYAWTGGATTQDRTGLAAGGYTVTVTDNIGCKGTLSVSVLNITSLTITETHVNPACGANNGSIDITPSGGTSPYTYAWTGGVTTQDRTGLASGTYTVTVNDNTGCTGTLSVNLTAIGLNIAESHEDAVCNQNTGSIDITPSGGTQPYTYAWSGGVTTQDRTGLAPGNYTITVTDNTGCAKTASITIGNLNTNCSCSTVFMDSGGAAGQYGNNENTTTTFCSNNGLPLSFSFSGGGSNMFDIDCPGDSLIFYDGTTATGTPIAFLTYLDDNSQTGIHHN
jgi:hypothetical protein